MLIVDQLHKNDVRLRTIAVVVVVGIVILVGGLWRLQVLAAQNYERREEAQSIRLVRVPAVRGRILDRNGIALAENSPSYDVNLYLEELRPSFAAEYTNRVLPEAKARAGGTRLPLKVRRQLEEFARLQVYSNTVLSVSQGLNRSLEPSGERFLKHYRQDLALPLSIVEALGPAEMALFFERCRGLPGVDLEAQPMRSYPFHQTAAHVLGHLRRSDGTDTDSELIFFRYRLPDFLGVAGVEGRFDTDLRGRAGVKALRVNSQGYRHEEEMWQQREAGQDVRLTLDLPIQRATERALFGVAGEATRGAAVVMDVRTGELLAVVSAPGFDPNGFMGGLTPEDLDRLNDEKQRPQMNRAVSGAYPPGSIFKIVTALAALEAGVLDPAASHHYPGYWQMGKSVIDDLAAPGDYNFKRAFIKSSNAYFIDHGLKAGRARIVATARRFGLGAPTGYALGTETAGYLPDERHLERLRAERDIWTEGDTAHLCIGQGALTVSPLQMAVLTAAVANGGRILEPQIIAGVGPAARVPANPVPLVRGEAGFQPVHLDLVRAAMLADVEESGGTGKHAAVQGMRICGKTGTAEVKRGRILVDKITWFVAYAPFESPRYAVVVVVESGASGGATSAPVVQRIFKAIQEREAGAGGPVPFAPAPEQALGEGDSDGRTGQEAAGLLAARGTGTEGGWR